MSRKWLVSIRAQVQSWVFCLPGTREPEKTQAASSAHSCAVPPPFAGLCCCSLLPPHVGVQAGLELVVLLSQPEKCCSAELCTALKNVFQTLAAHACMKPFLTVSQRAQQPLYVQAHGLKTPFNLLLQVLQAIVCGVVIMTHNFLVMPQYNYSNI